MRMSFLTCALACSIVAAVAGCSNKRRSEAATAPAAPADQAAMVPAPADKPAEASPAEPAADRKPRLRLTLRSTPTGAKAAVDGREVGQTPLVHEMESDGQVHEFTFVLPNYSMERYRFPPVRDGVVHATLRPIPQRDAGPNN